MNDITKKSLSFRSALAEGIVSVGKNETLQAIRDLKVPKGNVFETAKAAALLGIKKTSLIVPDCHPLPVEFASVNFEIRELEILITVEVKTYYKTGVEVEAMHGVMVAALTVYDMLKPIDRGLEIAHIRLLKKTGGKSGTYSA